MVRTGGIEPPRIIIHSILSAVRLPFRHVRSMYNAMFYAPAALRFDRRRHVRSMYNTMSRVPAALRFDRRRHVRQGYIFSLQFLQEAFLFSTFL